MRMLLPLVLALAATSSLPATGLSWSGGNAPVPFITITGTCPGPMTLTVSGATPGGLVAMLYGVPGSYTYPGTPCTGIVLGIINPNGTAPTLATTQTANSAGVLVINFNAPASVCGLSVQAVDVASCTTSNIVTL